MSFAFLANCQPSGGGDSSNGGSSSNGGNNGNGGSNANGGSNSNGGSSSSNGGSNSNGGSSSSNGGSSSSNGGSSSTGSGGSTSSTSTGTDSCTTDLMTLRTGTDFNWIQKVPGTCGIQGSVYAYGDGSTCTAPSPISATACTTASCCISGATVVDATYAKWGCGLGMDLNSSGGTTATKSLYAGSAKGFKITLTGTVSAGTKIRIQYANATSSSAISPYKEVTDVGSYSVLFADVKCPTWATAAQCTAITGSSAYSLQVQVVGGDAAGTFTNLCITSITPL